jgi:RNA polymerase sigma-70 factor (ECF subfamily)
MNELEKLAEKVLILRCQIGDKNAFAELIERYGKALRYFIFYLLGDSQIAEDIFQDTWLIVIRRIHALKESEAFPPWLYHIARNKVYEQFRRQKKFYKLDENNIIQNNSIEDNFSNEDAAKIHNALEKLSPAHKEILMLRFLEQMRYDQIAKVINCNVGTIKSRIYYAKLALKKEMEKS